jgi:hypothetical protein
MASISMQTESIGAACSVQGGYALPFDDPTEAPTSDGGADAQSDRQELEVSEGLVGHAFPLMVEFIVCICIEYRLFLCK